MFSALRDRRNARKNARAFQRARAEATAIGGSVCGTYKANGEPVYFVVPPGASDAAIQARAFAAREGRPMAEGEIMLKATVGGLDRTYRTGEQQAGVAPDAVANFLKGAQA